MKKIISIILCLAMFLSFASVPAFAADTGKVNIYIKVKWENVEKDENPPESVYIGFLLYGQHYGMGFQPEPPDDFDYSITGVTSEGDDYNKYDLGYNALEGYDIKYTKSMDDDNDLYLTVTYIYLDGKEPEKPEEYSPEFDPDDYIASGYCGAEGTGINLAWMIDSKGVLRIKGKGQMYNYAYDFSNWITTAPWANYLDKFNSLVLEEGITQIGRNAFLGCSNIKGKLTIPKSVTTINSGAFSNCSGFTGKLNLPNSLKTIGANAFLGCEGFTGDLVIPDSVTSLGSGAFMSCEGFNGKLVIPNGITTINTYVFCYCSGFTGELIIPKNVKSIGDWAFNDCKGFTGNLVIPDGVTSIGSLAFSSCNGFTGDLIIPDSVTTIGRSAFSFCSGFDGNLVVGKNVSVIDGFAFGYCPNFKGSVVLHDKITKIGAEAFRNCSVDRFYFKGDAPVVIAATEEEPSFESAKDTIYYTADNTTWEIIDGKWNGYNAKAYDPNAKFLLGDCNGDGVINARDSQRLYEHIVGKDPIVNVSAEYKAADVNGDGVINARDSQRLYEHIVGKDPLD